MDRFLPFLTMSAQLRFSALPQLRHSPNFPYYGYKAQEIIFANVSNSIHADSLALFTCNIEILFADVTKPENPQQFFQDFQMPHEF